MNIERLELAYNRLAMLHTETMAELVETQKRMDRMSENWWLMLKHRIKTKLGTEKRWGDD